MLMRLLWSRRDLKLCSLLNKFFHVVLKVLDVSKHERKYNKMGIQKYLREISTRYTASSIIGRDINRFLSLFMLVIISSTGCIFALHGLARCLWTASLAGEFSTTEWNFESRAAPGLQYPRQGEELLHLTRAKTTKVWLLKFPGALRFTLLKS